MSRLTGKIVGCAEFSVSDPVMRTSARWPEAYASHYLAAGVAPEPAFVSLIESVYASLPEPEAVQGAPSPRGL